MDNEIMGLCADEIKSSREKHGSNELAEVKGISFLGRLLKNLSDPIIKILIAAFFVTLIFSRGRGAVLEAVGIAVSVVISTLVSTVSEYGSERAFRRMQAAAREQRCDVQRGGRRVNISVQELVVGDIVYVNAGDTVGADGVLVTGKLLCDMSAINGESAEVMRSADGEGEQRVVYRGTLVTAGGGVMRVNAVGKGSYYGRIAGEIQAQSGDSPLRQKLEGLAATLSKFGYFCAATVAAVYLLCAFLPLGSFVFTPKAVLGELLHALTLAVSIVVVAVPEGLPMMITVVLSSNMVRMQKNSIRVRKPVGIETAGNVDVLFTDKTGTLTYGKPKAVCFITGQLKTAKRSIDLGRSLKRMVDLCAVYATESRIEGVGVKRTAVGGNATERALLSEVLENSEPIKNVERSAFLPFDSRIKLSAATVESQRNGKTEKSVTLVKGAPEILIKHCKSCYGCDGSVIPLDKEAVLRRLEEISSKGIRALAIVTAEASVGAVRNAAEMSAGGKAADIEQMLRGATLVCIVGIRDEVRREAPRAIRSLVSAGIQTVMVTGDSLHTASAIARETGILSGSLYETVIEGEHLREMSDGEIKDILPSLRVVARAMPEDKSRLVRLAKEMGRVAAMTGDGLNDAPALKLADVGFAMGNGTEVAKEAGDMIIEDGNISSIEKAVLYGRTVFRSIRKFIVFQLTMNLSAVGISVIGPFIGIESPVTVIQMLWINLIMDTLAAIAFAGEAPLAGYMKYPPIPKNEPVLNGDMMTRIFVMGVYTVMTCLYFLTSGRIAVMFGGRESAEFLSGFFALFVFCGLFGAFNARSGRANILAGLWKNKAFAFIISTVFFAQLMMIYFGGEALRCVPLSLVQLKNVIAISVGIVPFGVLIEIVMKEAASVKPRTKKQRAVG